MKPLFFVLILLCSCGKSSVDSNVEKQAARMQIKSDKSSGVCKIVNDEIVRHFFSADVFLLDSSTIKQIFKTKPKITVVKKKGIYDDDMYINITYETRYAYVTLFKNKEGFYVEDALIRGDEVYLYNNCSIGMLKENFCKQMAIGSVDCDSVVIVDEDQTLALNYIFKNGRLKELKITASE